VFDRYGGAQVRAEDDLRHTRAALATLLDRTPASATASANGSASASASAAVAPAVAAPVGCGCGFDVQRAVEWGVAACADRLAAGALAPLRAELAELASLLRAVRAAPPAHPSPGASPRRRRHRPGAAPSSAPIAAAPPSSPIAAPGAGSASAPLLRVACGDSGGGGGGAGRDGGAVVSWAGRPAGEALPVIARAEAAAVTVSAAWDVLPHRPAAAPAVAAAWNPAAAWHEWPAGPALTQPPPSASLSFAADDHRRDPTPRPRPPASAPRPPAAEPAVGDQGCRPGTGWAPEGWNSGRPTVLYPGYDPSRQGGGGPGRSARSATLPYRTPRPAQPPTVTWRAAAACGEAGGAAEKGGRVWGVWAEALEQPHELGSAHGYADASRPHVGAQPLPEDQLGPV
jgi:hypothetical protein